MNLNFKYYGKEAANSLKESLQPLGMPPENKILLIIPTGDQITAGGIYIPDASSKEDMPRKGTVIQKGFFTEGFEHWDKILQPGTLITYGLYAGKTVEVEGFQLPEGWKLTVLSVNEILYIEHQ